MFASGLPYRLLIILHQVFGHCLTNTIKATHCGHKVKGKFSNNAEQLTEMAEPNTTSNMSLRGEPHSPVKTYLTAGPWPAGPTKAYNKPLGVVDLVAGKGSIFRRRFERSGNYLIRLRQPDFKLPQPTPNEPLTFNDTMDEANPGDSPLPPPTALRQCLPDFKACGVYHCDDDELADYHANGDDVEDGEFSLCRKCEYSEPRAEMHPLPCAHLLCPACLSLTAINAIAAAHSDDPVLRRSIREAAGELSRLRRDLAPAGAPGLRAAQEARMRRYEKELLGHLGLSCCGQDMRLLDDWILCLDEWVARSLWAVTWRLFRGEGQLGALYCGWRDCGAAIPAWCRWENDEGEWRWYCVACRGNSQSNSQGHLVPAR